MSDFFGMYAHLTDEQWLDVLKKSIGSRQFDGMLFPDFPSEDIQVQFVGSSYEHALTEASAFYRIQKSYSAALAMPINPDSRVLDFGVGWGRFIRIIAKDIKSTGIYGVDVDKGMIDFCKMSNLPGIYNEISARGGLDFQDGYFSHIISYSVFTHLPEDIQHHWLSEIARVCASGAVFCCTVEPPRFLKFITESKVESQSEWHRYVKQALAKIGGYEEILSETGFLYIPTGGGGVRTSDVYGDTVIAEKYVKSHWSKHFKIIDYIDDPSRFWEAVVVLQKY